MFVNCLIFLAGLLIYAGYGLPGFLYLLGAVALTYGIGLLIPKRKWLMWVSISVLAHYLLLLKLQPVTGFTLLAPMGVSYFSLRLIGYMVDVYKGEYAPERNIFRFALNMTYLPMLFLGPISPYQDAASALRDRKITWEGIGDGLMRLLWGAFKKLVIAARLGAVIGTISGDPAQYSGAYALLAMLLFSVQLYADFSGGMDMVLGISRMLGVTLTENFRQPYHSETVKEFWKRWHISLGAWLTKYVYIPLGGKKKHKALNVIVTFLVSGIWHGIEYLLWGLFNGLLVLCGDHLKTRWKFLNRLLTTIFISFLWAFFIWPTAIQALQMTFSAVIPWNIGDLLQNLSALGLTVTDWIVLGGSVMLLTLYDFYAQPLKNLWIKLAPWKKTALIGTLGLLVAVLGMYGIGFNAEAFIYSRF